MKYSTRKLKDIAQISTGKLDSNAAVAGGRYPFFTCDPTTLSIDRWAYDTEAVLLAGNNASGNYTAKYYKGKFNAYQRTYIIESANQRVLNARFLSYALNQELRLLKTMSSGSTTKFLTIRLLNNLDIPCPNVDIQGRISESLGMIDNLIENNQKQIKLLEEAAQRLYQEWFVKLRFPGHEKVKVVDGVPEGWKKCLMSEVCDTIGGGTPSTKNPEYYTNGTVRWVTPTDITKNNSLILLDSEKRITEEGLEHSSAKMLPPYTILMTSRASVGFFGLCEHPVCTNQGFISCVPYNENVQLYLLGNLINRVEEIRQKATGSTFLEISKKTFRNMEIIVPDSEVLNQYNATIHPMIKMMEKIAKSIRQLTEARDRLLPKLMSGEIEV